MQSDRLAIKPLLKFYKDAPIGKSIDDVSHGLAKCALYIPTEGVHEPGKPLKMKVSGDNQGRIWAYVYTDESELLAAVPNRSPFVKMRFADLFRIVEKDSRFGGISINHAPEYNYLIPREVFDTVRMVLQADPDSEKVSLD
jgi:hypothetical protein